MNRHSLRAVEPERASVFIVEDEPLLLTELERVLTADGLRASKFTSAERFLEIITPESTGCLLADVKLPRMSGLDLQEELVRRGSPLSVVVITAYADVPLALRAMKAGALDMLEKPFDYRRMLTVVRTAVALSEEKAARIVRMTAARTKLDALTDREREVVALAIQGTPNKMIAQKLDISWRTVEGHRSNILQKLGIGNTLDLINLCHESAGIFGSGADHASEKK